MARKLAKEQKTKDLTKEQAKELSYDTVNDLVIDSAIVLAEDLANEKDDSVKVFYNFTIISRFKKYKTTFKIWELRLTTKKS